MAVILLNYIVRKQLRGARQHVRKRLGDRRTGRSALPFDWERRARSEASYHIVC